MKNRIRDLREDQDLRQSDLAKATGIDQRTISNYETGKTNPDSDALIRLADFFGVTIDYLVGRTSLNLSGSAERIALIDETIDRLEQLKKLLS
ncbi:MAG: helix-turn-helix transcriptional regulator [Clostridia bacterium]|nr:helix-turn-helix transcriptional regulator [Clostridia bacterium]MDY6185085.1 helix-turn-helix transcriptional regulator [Eubacteriales bacterium]